MLCYMSAMIVDKPDDMIFYNSDFDEAVSRCYEQKKTLFQVMAILLN